MIFHDEAQVDTHAQYLKSRAGIALNETFPTKIEELTEDQRAEFNELLAQTCEVEVEPFDPDLLGDNYAIDPMLILRLDGILFDLLVGLLRELVAVDTTLFV